MKSKFYAIYDSKSEAFSNPFVIKTRGEALRGWTDAANDPKTQYYSHPADFTFFEIGEYEDQTGQLIPFETKIPLGTALEFKRDSLPQMHKPVSQGNLQVQQ